MEKLGITFVRTPPHIVSGKARPIIRNRYGAKIFTETTQNVTKDCLQSAFDYVNFFGGKYDWTDKDGNTYKLTATLEIK